MSSELGGEFDRKYKTISENEQYVWIPETMFAVTFWLYWIVIKKNEFACN